MKLLLDTDSLILLLSLGWLEETCQMLEVDLQHCCRLEAAPNMIKKAKWIARQYPTLDRDSAAELAQSLKAIKIEQAVGIRDSFSQVEGIDPGEAELLVVTDETPDTVLVTGDKRFLRALAAAENSEIIQLRKRMAGRILFFTQLLLPLSRHLSIKRMDTDWRKAELGHRDLRIIFGTQPPVAAESFRGGIELSLSHVVDALGSDYLFDL